MRRSTGLLFIVITFLSCTHAQNDLKQLHTKYGDIIFAALSSVPESKNQFLEITGKEFGESNSPGELSASIPEDIKQNLLIAISSNNSHESFANHIEYWILAYNQLNQAQSLTSTEETMAAIYDQEQTQGLFKSILANRGMGSDINPLVVGSTLSSAETNELLYRTLNVISEMDAKDQLIYFSELYATLADFKIGS